MVSTLSHRKLQVTPVCDVTIPRLVIMPYGGGNHLVDTELNGNRYWSIRAFATLTVDVLPWSGTCIVDTAVSFDDLRNIKNYVHLVAAMKGRISKIVIYNGPVGNDESNEYTIQIGPVGAILHIMSADYVAALSQDDPKLGVLAAWQTALNRFAGCNPHDTPGIIDGIYNLGFYEALNRYGLRSDFDEVVVVDHDINSLTGFTPLLAAYHCNL